MPVVTRLCNQEWHSHRSCSNLMANLLLVRERIMVHRRRRLKPRCLPRKFPAIQRIERFLHRWKQCRHFQGNQVNNITTTMRTSEKLAVGAPPNSSHPCRDKLTRSKVVARWSCSSHWHRKSSNRPNNQQGKSGLAPTTTRLAWSGTPLRAFQRLIYTPLQLFCKIIVVSSQQRFKLHKMRFVP